MNAEKLQNESNDLFIHKLLLYLIQPTLLVSLSVYPYVKKTASGLHPSKAQ